MRKLLEKTSLKDLFRLLGILLFLGIIYSVNLSKIWNKIKDANYWLLLLGIILSYPMILIRATRWNHILKKIIGSVPLTSTYLYQFVGLVGFFTPGRLGELVKSLYLKSRGENLAESILSIFLDRILDVFVVTIVGCVFIIATWPDMLFGGDEIFYGSILLLGFVLLIVFITWKRSFVKMMMKFFLPSFLHQHLRRLYESLKIFVTKIDFTFSLTVGSLSVFAYIVQVYRVKLFTQSIEISIPFFTLAGIMALNLLLSIVPISVSGLGTREAVFIYFFTQYGSTAEGAVTVSLIILVNILLNSMFGSILFTIYPPRLDVKKYVNKLM